jgi:hypothetical protein
MKSISNCFAITLILFCFSSCNINKVLKTEFSNNNLLKLNKCAIEFICKKIDSVRSKKVNYVLFIHYGLNYATYYLFTQNNNSRYTVYKINRYQSSIISSNFSDSFARLLKDTVNMINNYKESSLCLYEIEIYENEKLLREFYIYNNEYLLEIKNDNYFIKYSLNLNDLLYNNIPFVRREQMQRVLREILTLHCCEPEVNNLDICD